MVSCCGVPVESWKDYFDFVEQHLDEAWLDNPPKGLDEPAK